MNLSKYLQISDEKMEKPSSEMRLFGIRGAYFDSKEELESYCENKGFSINDAHILEYIRHFANRSDVIKVIDKYGSRFYTAVDEDGYGIYNHERSIKEFIWEFHHGHIKDLYSPFRDRGIIFENDIYEDIAKKNKQLKKIKFGSNIENENKK